MLLQRYATMKNDTLRESRKAAFSDLEESLHVRGHEEAERSEDVTVNKLPEKKRGHAFMLGEELEMQVRA